MPSQLKPRCPPSTRTHLCPLALLLLPEPPINRSQCLGVGDLCLDEGRGKCFILSWGDHGTSSRTASLTWCPAPPGVACSVILMYTFCTDCWLIAVLYFTWLAFDWNTPKKGNRSSLPPVSPTPQEAPARLQPLLDAASFFTEHLLCERPGLGCVWLGVGGLKLPRCLHRGAHLSLGMAGGMYVGKGHTGQLQKCCVG